MIINSLCYALGGPGVMLASSCTAKTLMQERFYRNKQMIRWVFCVAMVFVLIGIILFLEGGATFISLFGSGVL